MKTCNWAGKKNTPTRCRWVPVRNNCPDTCGLCEDDPDESSQPSALPSDQPSLTPTRSVSPWECDDNFNFILNLNYNQISLTDGCDANNICDANPIYAEDGITNNMEEAAAFCKTRCEDSIPGCAGFFFQNHQNGHEICGFYADPVNMHDGTWVKHGHQQEGSRVCELIQV
jgi:hypothetical protein